MDTIYNRSISPIDENVNPNLFFKKGYSNPIRDNGCDILKNSQICA